MHDFHSQWYSKGCVISEILKDYFPLNFILQILEQLICKKTMNWLEEILEEILCFLLQIFWFRSKTFTELFLEYEVEEKWNHRM